METFIKIANVLEVSADMLLADIHREVSKIQGVEKVNITLTFEPQWDKSMMSEEALLELNLL